MPAGQATRAADPASEDGGTRRESRAATREGLIRALVRTRDARQRRALLARVPHLHDGVLARRLHEEAMRFTRLDLTRAERLVHAARLVAERVGDDVVTGRSLRAEGHVLSLRGQHRQALVRYRAALARLAAPEHAEERAITLSGGLQTLIYLGEYERAHQWAAQAREMFLASGDALRLARLDMNVGNVLYRQDRFREALACYENAHRAFEQFGDATDVGVVLRNMAVCWISLNDFSSALKAHEKAHAWCRDHGMPLLAAEADYNIAYLHYLRGEYARAIELYQATRVYCHRVGDRYHHALCDLDQSEIYLEINLNEDGGEMAARAALAFKALGMRYETGKARVNMGVAAARVGEHAQALALFGQARRLFQQEGNGHWLTVTDVYRALVLAEIGRTKSARRLGRSALAYFVREGPPGKAALAEVLLARLELKSGNPRLAWLIATHAVQRAKGAEATALAAQGLHTLGEIYEALGNLDGAYLAFQHAHAGLETLRSHLAGDQLKIAFLEDKKSVYEALVSLALQREPETTRARVAFRYIEQAKSRSLADVMSFGPPSISAERGGPAAQRVADLRAELTWWRRRIEAHESGRRGSRWRAAGAIRERARDCETRLARAQAELEMADAELCVLASGNALPIEAIQSSIPPGTALIEYYETRGTILGCVLTRDRLEIAKLGPAAQVRELLRLLQFQISKFRLDRSYAVRFAPQLHAATTSHLQALYKALLGPLLERISARHLVVIPHGILHYLPFHALHDGTLYVLDRFSVSYAPSATVYYLCRARASQAEAHSLVLGVPDPRAPQIHDEIEAVSAALPASRVFVGADATVRRLQEDGRTARYIHVATHGLFRQDNPMFSAVRLGDGELSLLDLYDLRLSADLVTLSGCGTGLSAVVGGDELVGLVRGLLYAGARAVLVTLWDVNDRSTAAFMQSFYHHMSVDPHKGRAVTAAMQDIRARFPHPYFWAPFALVGDPDEGHPAEPISARPQGAPILGDGNRDAAVAEGMRRS